MTNLWGWRKEEDDEEEDIFFRFTIKRKVKVSTVQY